jgi:hypothetical protein
MPTFAIDPRKLEDLLNYCVGFAKQMVERHGAFHPFGAVIVSDGTLNAVGAHIGDEHPHGADVFRFLQSAMRAQFKKQEIIAAGIATDGNGNGSVITIDTNDWQPVGFLSIRQTCKRPRLPPVHLISR